MARTSMRPIATRMVGAGGPGAATPDSLEPRSRWPFGRGRTILGVTGEATAGGARVASGSDVPPLASRGASVPGEGTGG
jgi:hypothetical protein